jgi:hypothetical protein
MLETWAYVSVLFRCDVTALCIVFDAPLNLDAGKCATAAKGTISLAYIGPEKC